MSQWSFNASGFTGDVEKIAELVNRIGLILAEPEFGTSTSQVFSPQGLANNFHLDAVPPAAGDESSGEASSPDTDTPADQDGVPPAAVATASQAPDADTGDSPPPD